MNGFRHRCPWRVLAVPAFLFALACEGSESTPDTQPGDVQADGQPDVPGDPGFEAVDPGPPDTPPDHAYDVFLDQPSVDLPDVPPPAPHPLFDFVGGVWLVEYPDPTTPNSVIDVRASDKADPPQVERVGAAGDCELWIAKSAFPQCAPPCDLTHYCDADLNCVSQPVRVGMGTVSIDLKGQVYDFVPDDTSWYTGPTSIPTDLFDPSTSLTVTAAGGTVPAFERTLQGIADLVLGLPDRRVTLLDGQDNEFTWTPAGDGSTVEVVLQTGWHGAPPTSLLWCQAPDVAGRVVMPQALVEGVGILDPDQPSLFQHPSYARRVRRTFVESAGGPLEVTLTSQVGLVLKHVP